MTAPKKKPDGAKRKQSDLEEEREEMRRELRRELHAEMERQAALPAQAKKPSRKNRQLVRWDGRPCSIVFMHQAHWLFVAFYHRVIKPGNVQRQMDSAFL
jgi:hypothetical protein